MVLTEEQKERIRENKEKALEIRRRRKEEKERKEERRPLKTDKEDVEKQSKETKDSTFREENVSASIDEVKLRQGDEEILEDFEIGASPHVTKQEAMKKYCLPQGTLEVCTFIEKDNPRQPKWSKMKLYCRDEIRRRSRERFGGLAGLIEERRGREFKRFKRDFEEDIFSKKQKKKK